MKRSVHLLSWNVGGLAARIYDQGFVSYVCKFDIVCLIETFTDSEFNAQNVFPLYNIYSAPAHKLSDKGRRSGGVTLLITKSLAVFYDYVQTDVDNLICVRFSKHVFSTDRDIMMLFAYVHPQNSPWYHQSDADCDIENIDICLTGLLKKYGDVHFLVCGDFNSRVAEENPLNMIPDYDMPGWSNKDNENQILPRSSEDKTSNSFGEYLLSLCAVFELAILNGTCNGDKDGKFTFISPIGSSVIDYCLISLDLLSLNLHLNVGDQILSHHLPLELLMSRKTLTMDKTIRRHTKVITKIVWDEERKEEMIRVAKRDDSQILYREATKLISSNPEQAIETFTDFLTVISSSMKKVIVNSESSKNPSWFDLDCRNMKKETTRALRNYRKTKRQEERLLYCKLRKDYKQLQKTKRKLHQEEQLKILTENSNDTCAFWRVMRKILSKSQPSANISLLQWQNHFKSLLQTPTIDVNISEEQDVSHEINSEITDAPITKEEIIKGIKHLKKNKAAGWDGIPGEMLKHVDVISFLLKYFNAIFETGYFPQLWSKSVIVPIYKKGDVDSPGNYRGVTLVSAVCKVFTYILNKRLTIWIEEGNMIAEEQAGYRAGYSTSDHIFTLHSIIQKNMLQGKGKCYVAFIDYRKAFDSVNRECLWNCLRRKGLSRKMLNILESMYERVLCCVRSGHDYTEFFDSPVGVKQGCSISPNLFCLLINEVAEELRRRGRHGVKLSHLEETFSLLFADDVALVSFTPVGLQNQLNVLSEVSNRIGLKVNLDKTKIMVFRKGGHLGKYERWFMNGDRLAIVNSYTYLGYTFTTKVTANRGLLQTCVRAKRKVHDILRALWKIGCTDVKIFLRLFDQQVLPTITYAAEVWGVKETKIVEQVHMYACKKILSVSTKTPNTMIYGELGRYPLFVNTFIQAVKYWLKILEMPSERLPKAAYDTLKSMDERGKKTWATSIRDILFRYGFGYVWTFQGVGNKSRFMREFRERLVDCYRQEWHDKISTSERFNRYKNFKQILEYEGYLSSLSIKRYRDAIVRSRLGINCLHDNKFRYNPNASLRFCPLCNKEEEDEIHFIFICHALHEPRKIYIKPYIVPQNPTSVNYENMLKMKNVLCLAKYITEAQKIRSDIIDRNH